jgi:hypothetical protein
MAIKTTEELKAYFETGDVPTQDQFVDLIDTLFSAIPDYKVYKALLTQSGSSAPTATVLKNTLGGTVVWSYLNTGNYLATLSNGFPVNSTGMLIQRDTDNFIFNGGDDSSISVLTKSSGVNSNNLLYGTYIEVIVQD